MKAAILVKSKKPLILGDLELPKNLTYGQVKVKVFYSGICGAQINEIDAVKGKDKFLPHLLGHEGSGIGGNWKWRQECKTRRSRSVTLEKRCWNSECYS